MKIKVVVVVVVVVAIVYKIISKYNTKIKFMKT